MIRTIVCGGRDVDMTHEPMIWQALDSIERMRGQLFVIHGGANGVDLMAGRWADSRGRPSAMVRANWSKMGRIAGPIRNGWLLELEPHMGVVFPGGRGTFDMKRRLLAARIPTWVVEADGTMRQEAPELIAEEMPS